MSRDDSTARRRLLGLGAALAALAAAAILLPVREWAERLLELARGLGALGGVAYVGAYVLACVLLVPGTILTLGAGFLFGTAGGMAVVVPGCVLGATAAFLVGRTFGREWVEQRVRGNRTFEAVDRAVARRGFRTVLLLRLSPVLPFNLLNYALGLTSVRLRDYVLATALGTLPFSLLVVRAGSLATSLAGLDDVAPHGALRRGLVVGGVVMLLIAVMVTGRAARRALDESLAEDATA